MLEAALSKCEQVEDTTHLIEQWVARRLVLPAQRRWPPASLLWPGQLISSNNGWHDGWFYLRNDDGHLPRFSSQVLMSRKENWVYGVIEED
jgi:hypothetical protein